MHEVRHVRGTRGVVDAEKNRLVVEHQYRRTVGQRAILLLAREEHLCLLDRLRNQSAVVLPEFDKPGPYEEGMR